MFFIAGEDFVRERTADGRQAAWIVPSLPRLRRIWKLSTQSHQQEWQNHFGEYILFLTPFQKFEEKVNWFYFWQPVGFVTFATRASAEGAKQDLQVTTFFPLFFFGGGCRID